MQTPHPVVSIYISRYSQYVQVGQRSEVQVFDIVVVGVDLLELATGRKEGQGGDTVVGAVEVLEDWELQGSGVSEGVVGQGE